MATTNPTSSSSPPVTSLEVVNGGADSAPTFLEEKQQLHNDLETLGSDQSNSTTDRRRHSNRNVAIGVLFVLLVLASVGVVLSIRHESKDPLATSLSFESAITDTNADEAEDETVDDATSVDEEVFFTSTVNDVNGVSAVDTDPVPVREFSNTGGNGRNRTVSSPLPIFTPEEFGATYDSCDALRDDYMLAIRHQRDLAIDAIAKDIFQLYDDDYYSSRFNECPECLFSNFWGSSMSDTIAGASTSSASGEEQDSEDSYFTTNQKSEDIDEADIVKSDGEYVYVLQGDVILQLNADNVEVLQQVTIESTVTPPAVNISDMMDDDYMSFDDDILESMYTDVGHGMLLVGNYLVVFMQFSVYGDNFPPAHFNYFGERGTQKVNVLIYDKVTLELQDTVTSTGQFVAAREIENTIHVVTKSSIHDQPSWYNQIYNQMYRGDNNDFEDYEDVDDFKAKILMELESDGSLEDQASKFVTDYAGDDCTNFEKLVSSNLLTEQSYNYVEFALLSITSLDPSDPVTTKSSRSLTLPHSNWHLYASKNHLVFSIPAAGSNDISTDNDDTSTVTSTSMLQSYIMVYDIEGVDITARSIGSVPGYVLNQFSIHHNENDDGQQFLYVASTSEDPTSEYPNINSTTADDNTMRELQLDFDDFTDDNATSLDGDDDYMDVFDDDFMGDGGFFRRNTTSQVSVFELTSSSSDVLMPVVGQVSGLGKSGEEIYSVRFHGARAYVVTYVYTDPFYTIDLSDPYNPLLMGEIEMHGFSSYLHPVGDDLIIGVGRNTDDEGVELGFMVSLFDVSDLANPVVVDSISEGGEMINNTASTDEEFISSTDGDFASTYSNSQVESDYRAFRYFSDRQLLVIPVTLEVSHRRSWCMDNVVDDDYCEGYTDDMEIPESFSGFRVYKIDPELGISTYMSIEQRQYDVEYYYGNDDEDSAAFADDSDKSPAEQCSSYESMLQPSRSFVFNHDIMTIRGSTILSHDIDTMAQDADPIYLGYNYTSNECIDAWSNRSYY